MSFICKKCGEENDERFAFCTACGTSLESSLPVNPLLTQADDSDAVQKLDQATPSGGFTSNNPSPTKLSMSESFGTANRSAFNPASSFGSQLSGALPPPTDQRGETIAPPSFASNLSYREPKGNSKLMVIAGATVAVMFLNRFIHEKF